MRDMKNTGLISLGERNQPLICTPIVGKKREFILAELNSVLAKKPDIIEWRADFFEGIANTNEVITIAKQIKRHAGDIPIILTIRSIREGGQPIPFSDAEVIKLLATVCSNTDVEYIDYELSNLPEHIKELYRIASENNTKIIASFHNFNLTPDRETLLQKFTEAKKYGADVAKVAVMPKNLNDVLTLLSVTLEAKNTIDIPVITVSMGGYGALTRMIGGVFGSAVTFAVGQSSSAPGQVPIEDLRTVLRIIQKSIGSEADV
jgi:3-dehydroquinate dehydratase I